MRVLFLNEGNLGTHIMGQGQLVQALRTGLAAAPDIEARFAGLTPMGRIAQAAATRPLQPLTRLDLDLRPLRWYMVQSRRARSALHRELRAWPAQAVHVHSHSIALGMGATMRALPAALSLDTTMRDWLQMPAWRRSGRRFEVSMAPGFARERHALTRAALVLAWTTWAKNAAERTAPHANVVEHHPGIELDRYRPAVSRHERALPRVLFVGGRFAEKGGEDLLYALGEELGRSVELDLVTPAPVQPRPGVRVHRLEPSDPRLLELQQQADVFCLPTHGDAAPWAVLEAMACATPVLSTRIGGIPDMLDSGRAGLLVAHGDRRALREALLALLADASLRARLAATARERCEDSYDCRRQFQQLMEHLRQTVTSRRNRPRSSPGRSAPSPNSSAG
jgi:glycosyltransferase involved in cell wall biosynthesis